MFFRSGKKSGGTLSINEPIDSERGDGDLTLSDVLADSVFVDEACEQKAEAEKIRQLVDTHLDGRERQIVRLRYGFGGNDPLTQQEIAGLLGISRSYVSRLEKKALEKLKSEMDHGGPKDAPQK